MFKKYKNYKLYILGFFVLLATFNYLFFKAYKDRKLIQYEKLKVQKNLHIDKLEKTLSYYYHNSKEFNFIKEKDIKIKNKLDTYSLKKIRTNLWFSKVQGNSTAYVSEHKESIILTTATGLIFSIKKNELSDDTRIKHKLIQSNISDFIFNKEFYLRSNIGIKDTLVNKNFLYLSFSNEIKPNCFNVGILRAKINNQFLEFKKFFSSSECMSASNAKYKFFSNGQSGGRLQAYGKDILLSHGSFSLFEEVQDPKSIFGKILLITDDGKSSKVFSMGHRNPQGLFYDKSKKIIVETEHGPNGGDEINIIQYKKNYGWPLASYGKHYKGQIKMNEYYPLPNEHKGFETPAKFFQKSVAISQIISVPKKYSNKNSDIFFLATMKINNDYGNEINILELEFVDNKFYIKDIIPINERIRDIIYSDSLNSVIMFLDSSASVAILKKIN
jgi:hypothetical protein